jgi:hypothetical protein
MVFLPQLQARLALDAPQGAGRDIAHGVRNRDSARLDGMLELNMAALLSHLFPPIRRQRRYHISAIDGVCLYTPISLTK